LCIFASVKSTADRPIVVNARFLLPGKMEGIGCYTHEILSRVTSALPERKFIFLFDRPFDKNFIYGSNITPVVIPPQARHPFLWYIWFEWSVSRLLKSVDAAVFFSPDGYGSLRSDVPQVITIHDLAFEHYPEQIPALVRRFYSYAVPRYIQHADKIIAVSAATASDITSTYGTPAEKIRILHNGCTFTISTTTPSDNEQVRKALTGGVPYFIFVSALHPRKNIEGVLKAFDKFAAESGKPHYLVVAGRRAWGNKSMEETYENMANKDKVVFSGHLERADLFRSLSAAEALVYPSFFEGFGLPLLEAMYCDVPVITSDRSSMPEVAGDAALLVSPDSVKDISDAMYSVSADQALRESLVSAGQKQRLKFSWDQSAAQVAAILSAYH